MSASRMTRAEAQTILGVSPGASLAEAATAFRAAAKHAHPDRAGGDAERFRLVLAAHRLLQATPNLPATIPASEPAVDIDPLTALRGGEAVTGDGRLRLRIPAGARHGERLSAAGRSIAVRIAATDEVQVRGSDLWVTAQVAGFLLDEGGRANIETPLGPKVLWISRKIAERRLVRLEGQGLPARGDYPQGSLFIRLAPEAGEPESVARAQLKKFAAAWAA
jgi:curved DNA-binding protein